MKHLSKFLISSVIIGISVICSLFYFTSFAMGGDCCEGGDSWGGGGGGAAGAAGSTSAGGPGGAAAQIERFNMAKPGEQLQNITLNTSLSSAKYGKTTYETFSAGLTYAVPGWYLSLNIPYVHNRKERLTASSDKLEVDGLGDISFMAWYALTSKIAQVNNEPKISSTETTKPEEKKDLKQSDSPTTILLGIGLKFPTGQDDIRDKYGLFPIELQPGKGTLDGLIGISATKKVFKSGTGFAGMVYQLTGGTNSINYERKDKIHWSSGLGYEVSKKYQVGISLALNGTYIRDEDRSNGQKVVKTKGNWIYFSPSINIKPSENKNIYLCLGFNFPVREVSGSRYGLDRSISFSAGLGF